MKNDFAYIAILLDRSGSMRGSETDVVGGVNTFIEEQRKVPGEALITIARFDDEYETIHEDVSIKDAPLLELADFVPRGGTALADAMNRLIVHVGAKLNKMQEKDRPGHVNFLVFSDGQENASKEISSKEVRESVKHQEEVYSWKFLFFGMDVDALAVGQGVGVKGLSGGKGAGIGRTARAASAYVGNNRMGNKLMADKIYGSRGVEDKDVQEAIEHFSKSLKKGS